MSRVIKFRAWDEREKSMSDPFTLFRLDGMFKSSPTSPVTYRAIRSDDIIMQFTGLHDKEGKEIYDKDIVHIQYNHFGNKVVEWIEHEGRWNIGGYNLSKCKLVGSVYTTPELIK
jgi:uncharacterized phage protein (TIGR01671 family)